MCLYTISRLEESWKTSQWTLFNPAMSCGDSSSVRVRQRLATLDPTLPALMIRGNSSLWTSSVLRPINGSQVTCFKLSWSKNRRCRYLDCWSAKFGGGRTYQLISQSSCAYGYADVRVPMRSKRFFIGNGIVDFELLFYNIEDVFGAWRPLCPSCAPRWKMKIGRTKFRSAKIGPKKLDGCRNRTWWFLHTNKLQQRYL